MSLTPRIGSAGLSGPLLRLDSTSSTNDTARELALAGAPHGTAVIAEQQSAGRGRRGRAWLAPRDRALTLSVIARTDIGRLRLLPLVAPLAVCDASERVASGVSARIKWPNDVWIEGRKLAGILIEARPREGWAVLGIGINVSTTADEFPAELRELATSLETACGASISRDDLLEALFEELALRLEQDGQSQLDDYRSRDALLGQDIEWNGGSGTAQGIDDHGNLVVFTSDAERLTLDAGEVHLVRPN